MTESNPTKNNEGIDAYLKEHGKLQKPGLDACTNMEEHKKTPVLYPERETLNRDDVRKSRQKPSSVSGMS